jgi:hypothetical protein
MIIPPTRALYFTKKAMPKDATLRTRTLTLFVCTHEKNNNNETVKKKSNVVSSSAILESQIKPDIDANRILESSAFLGP